MCSQIPQQPSRVSNAVAPIIQMLKLRLREMKQLGILLSIPRLDGLAAFSQPGQMAPSGHQQRHWGCDLELVATFPIFKCILWAGALCFQ